MRESTAKPIAARVALALAITAGSAPAATIVIDNADGPMVGFNDPAPALSVGGNMETTRGAQALAAFQKAASLWEAALDSPVPIHVSAKFVPLPCSKTTGRVGGATPHEYIGNPPGAKQGILYPVALANRLAGVDLKEGAPDIDAEFNGAAGTPGCLENQGWYFGLDGMPLAMQVDLVTTVAHELAHGLGMTTPMNLTTGEFLRGVPDVYTLRLLDERKGVHFGDMDDAGRAESVRAYHQVSWDGPEVTSLVSTLIDRGMPSLTFGKPLEKLSPAFAIAGFGLPFGPLPLQAPVAAVDDGTNAPGDACEAPMPLTGKIALVEAGGCDDATKIKNVQGANAATAILVSDLLVEVPFPFTVEVMDVHIPVVRINRTDAATILGALGQGLIATLIADANRGIGTSAAGRLYVDATDPVIPGISLTHWDPMVSPPLLMDPVLPTTHSLDLTVAVMHDIGWRPYRCGDGFVEGNEQCDTGDGGAGGPCSSTCTRLEDAGADTSRPDGSSGGGYDPYADASVSTGPLTPDAPNGIVWAKKHGCSCRMVGTGDAGRSSLLVAALAGAALLGRRRRP